MAETIKIARCARCKGAFVKIRFPVCDQCVDDEESDYQRISDVLADDTNKNVEMVAEAAEVTTACVLRMLDRGLIANEQVAEDIRCGQCGEAAISAAKRLCHRCLVRLDQKFFSEINEAKRVRAEQESTYNVHDTIGLKRSEVRRSKKR